MYASMSASIQLQRCFDVCLGVDPPFISFQGTELDINWLLGAVSTGTTIATGPAKACHRCHQVL